MKVCIFTGSYDFNEDKLFQKVLELQDVEVFACREDIHSVFSGIKAYFKMFFQHRKLDYDVMIIPWRGIFTFPLAKLVCKKPIIFWSTLSIYHTLIEDRKIANPNSLKAKMIHFAEKYAVNHSDIIITESRAQSDFLINEYNLEKEKLRNSVNCIDETKFLPMPLKKQDSNFVVTFFGSFLPAHGTETMIEAAKILSKEKDIVFDLCGDGLLKKTTEELAKKYQLKNVKFPGYLELDIILDHIRDSDVCLGIFGKSMKADNSIAYKILQILATQKPLITMDSKAMKEVIVNGENCILVPPGNPQKLAEAILILKNDPAMRENIALNGYQLYLKKLSTNETMKRFLEFFKEAQQIHAE